MVFSDYGIRSKQLFHLDEQTVRLHWQVADEMGKLFGRRSYNGFRGTRERELMLEPVRKRI